jgi:phosphoserine phosphatase
LYREREAILHRMFPEARLMPGAERLVRHLSERGVRIALVSGRLVSHRFLLIVRVEKKVGR